ARSVAPRRRSATPDTTAGALPIPPSIATPASAPERGHDRVDVVHAAAPRSAARLLQRRPQPRVVRDVGVGGKIGARQAGREHARALLRRERAAVFADEIDRALEPVAIDDDTDRVAVSNAADRPAGERLGADVADAGAGRNTGEARIGDHRDVL